MVQTCRKCARANPREAVYCHFDGSALAGHARIGGPLAVGSQRFPSPFVFPDGRACPNFDELALGCQARWAAARDLLRQGRLEAFLAALGRLDLASAARESARFPDADRGLDQLLVQLPTGVLDGPTLRLEPREVSLGALRPGDTRAFDLHLENQGMRLLYGSVRCDDAVWLVLGEAPGVAEKHFQFTQETTVPVRVRGERLRASMKPLAARLVVESNGGSGVVVVRAEVPARPFPEGVLSGALTPRQAAERAKKHPREAAPLFERGAVEAWYASNGWDYPVRGPCASGLGAVQQFFEALGLTPPPKVEVGEASVALAGLPGQSLSHTLEVRSAEKRPVYAHAGSDAPWLEVGRARLNGRSAALTLSVPSVPDRPGQKLTARVTVRANGNQRFVVPVTLTVANGVPAAPSQPAALPVAPPPSRTVSPAGRPTWLHALPAAALLAVLGVLVAVDAWAPAKPVRAASEGKGGVGFDFPAPTDPGPRLEFRPHPSGNLRFGLVLLRERDPNNPEKFKRLTYDESGGSNNTCVKIDGAENTFGRRPGRLALERVDKTRHAWLAAWDYESGVRVTQVVQVVPGDQTGLLDTCLIRYTVENRDREAHQVGLRVLFDTFIGAEDGVPFALAGQPGLIKRPGVFGEKQVPGHLQALERPDPASPGTVAYMGLKDLQLPGVTPEPVVKMVLGTWPGSEAKWDWDEPRAGNFIQDSAVTLYWDYRRTGPGEVREMAFSYGLNAISGSGGAGDGPPLALTVAGSFRAGSEFTATAFVKAARPGQLVRLTTPAGGGLELAYGESAAKEVPEAGAVTQVSWRVRPTREGTFPLVAESGGTRAVYQVRVANRGLFR